jgi:hypothetical protein
MFTTLGALLAVYTVYAAFTGRVFAKAGARGTTVDREASPAYFWTVIAIYGALSIALITVF